MLLWVAIVASASVLSQGAADQGPVVQAGFLDGLRYLVVRATRLGFDQPVNLGPANPLVPRTSREYIALYQNGTPFLSEEGVCGLITVQFVVNDTLKNNATLVSPDNAQLRELTDSNLTMWKTIPRCCEGFNLSSGYRCKPWCLGGCAGGKCEAPGRCVCNVTNTLDLSGGCVRTCPLGCPNGRCDGDACVCDPGYELRGRLCVPMCSDPCHNGNCTAPNTCECLPMHRRNPRGECEPYCFGGCKHGDCVGPNQCRCHEGYRKVGGDPDSNRCEAFCPNGCLHGRCAGPNTCVCDSGYRLNETGACEPVCSRRCENGWCTGPETCSCLPGYAPHHGDRHHCVPHCGQGGCGPNGDCMAPGICTCHPGFALDPTNSTGDPCNFQCVDGCANGQCVGPETCACDPGFTNPPGALNRCERQCDSCTRGQCVGYNDCRCPPGWKTVSGDCEPECHQRCVHSDCTAPDTCTCREGYVPDTSDAARGRCLPHCPGGCANGVCSGPSLCLCNAGFVKKNRDPTSNICVPA